MIAEIFKVSELNRFIKDVIAAGFPQTIWVCGEIQQYDRNKNKKHVFFELVEKDSASNDIVARIGLVIFSNRRMGIESVLAKSENAFELKDDIEVKFECQVDFYAPHGAIRLIVENIDPIYTLGKLAQEKQKLIAHLKEQGVLERNKQLELNRVPLLIGLITSYDSAAYNDFLSELKRSRYSFSVFFHNVLVQGKGAEKDICQAVTMLQKIKNLDAIVITRGGGSLAELSSFDSRLIAETIAGSRIPVLSGIGHEINMTITDLAAHSYAKTPTAIAQYLVSRIDEFLRALDEKGNYILTETTVRIEREKQRLKHCAIQLKSETFQYLRKHNEDIVRFSEQFRQRPFSLLRERQKFMADFDLRFQHGVLERIKLEDNRLRHFQKVIGLLHPTNTLRRGFSITRKEDGSVLKSIYQAKKEDTLITEVSDGKIKSKVQIINKEEGNG